MKKTKNLLIALSALSTICLTSCSSYRSLEKIQENGELIIATNAEFAPFEYLENDAPVGFDIDLIKAYCDAINVKAIIKDQDFDAALTSVSTKKADVAIAGITKNPSREATMSFSNSYFNANQVVIVAKNSLYSSLTEAESIIDALNQNNAKIGVQRGTTGEAYVDGDESFDFAGIPNATSHAYDNGALAVKALSNGQLDAVIIDVEPAKLYCKNITNVEYLDVVLTSEEYAIAVSKGNESLLNSINSFIETIKINGVYDTIVNKYFGSKENV